MRDFERTETGEPHARRRRELLARHPEIRALYGYDRRTAWVTCAVTSLQLLVAAWVGWRSSVGGVAGRWWAVLLAAWLVGAPLSHWLAMAVHETSHRLAARTARANTLLALAANLPNVVPLAMTFHRYHLDHHRLLGVDGEDTDLPLRAEVALLGSSAPSKLLWLLLHPLVYLARGLTYAKRPNGAELFNVVLMLAVDVAIYHWWGPAALAYLFVSFFFALGLHPVAGHFIHEHTTFAPGQETFSYYGPLNAISFNVGYHVEHHDFMNVSGWRLPELGRLVPEYAELVSDRSWTAVMWRFVTDRRLGLASRIVRSREAFERGRSQSRRPAHAA